MGKVVLTMQMSLDGVVSHEHEWMSMSEEILRDYLDYYRSVGTIVVGSHSYASLAQYWQQAEQSDDDLEREIAIRINEIPKVVITGSEVDLVWRNSRQLLSVDVESVVREIELLRESPGIVSVESGVWTWQRFIQNELYDELWLLVHPVVASHGERLFAFARNPASLTLTESKTYENGVVGLHYRK
ncbi:dihydrofolate reductase family protein [Cohnella sp. REN36]|uniref:dihydrofolate reductase family protein n=1 Tax=Cohnella sp. REN36 TaxID=2887347 RepID=UPI001D141DBD|nr:dihydrofolate reductase family protein [Cohnella sp. REN36]MCC3375332.1 dihydrofolate reductase family protein [Cohnella sp. REN36]